MDIKSIMQEADILVPNGVDDAQKIVWLNTINQDFFNVVKIPKTSFVTVTANTAKYEISSGILEKNVFRVRIGNFLYESMNYAQNPINNTGYIIDDDSHEITLIPAPYMSDMLNIGYFKAATTTYTSSNTASIPDAPQEYHWTYVPALCAYLAKTEDDSVKASNFEIEYKNAWNVAAQNYQQQVVQ